MRPEDKSRMSGMQHTADANSNWQDLTSPERLLGETMQLLQDLLATEMCFFAGVLRPVQNTPLQTAAVQAAAAPKPTIQTTVQSPTTQEACWQLAMCWQVRTCSRGMQSRRCDRTCQKSESLLREAAPIVLWERPPKPAGWSAIWEARYGKHMNANMLWHVIQHDQLCRWWCYLSWQVLPPPPPPPFGQDGLPP